MDMQSNIMVDPSQVVESVDGEIFPLDKARTYSKRMFFWGFLCLPLLWFVNVWLFWPEFWYSRDSVVRKWTKLSAVAFVIASVAFIPWMFLFAFSGEKALGRDTYNKLDVTRLDVKQFVGF